FFLVMKDSSYQHFCTLVVGVATLFRFISYDMATFIVESLLHYAHLRNPDAIINHAGYYGQAVKKITTCLAIFTVPVILNYLSPKVIHFQKLFLQWVLFIGSGLFTFYIACFFYINTILYFLANFLQGIAFARLFILFF
ncbi:hypothetical protein PFISCL1PPCAC_11785, partial [Pristionchus fissidentatus]